MTTEMTTSVACAIYRAKPQDRRVSIPEQLADRRDMAAEKGWNVPAWLRSELIRPGGDEGLGTTSPIGENQQP
jgi:hypothetical protein